MSLLDKYTQKYGNKEQVNRLRKSKDFVPETPTSPEKESNRAAAHQIIDNMAPEARKQLDNTGFLADLAQKVAGNTKPGNTGVGMFGANKLDALTAKNTSAYNTYKAANDIVKAEEYEKKREAVVRDKGGYAYKTMRNYIDLMDKAFDAQKGGGTLGALAGSGESSKLRKMAETVKKTLNDFGITGKEFEQYEQYVREYKDIESTQKMQNEIKNFIAQDEKHGLNVGTSVGMFGANRFNSNPLGHVREYGLTAADVLASPVTGLAATVESLKRPFYADPEAPVNTYSDLYALLNASNAIEEASTAQHESALGQKLYGVGVSTAKSAEAMLVSKVLGGALGYDASSKLGQLTTLPMFGASAFAQTLQESQAKGFSPEMATQKALASGMAEMLFEELSLDKAWGTLKNAKLGKGGLSKRILDVFMGAGIEGSEEIFTDLANHIADNFINGDFSDYQSGIRMRVENGMSLDQATREAKKEFIAQLVESGLAGAASGFAMNAGGASIGYVQHKTTAKNINANSELKREVVNSAKGLEGTTAAKIANKKIEEITENDMVEILHSMEEVTQKSAHDIAKESLVRMGESEEEAEKKASAIVEAVSEENPTEEQEAKNTKLVEDENTAEAYADVLKNRVAQNALSDVYENNQKVKQRRSGGITAMSNGNQIKVYDFADVNKGIVNTSVGAMSLDNVQMGENERRLFKTAYVFDNNNASNAYVNEYKGQNIADYSTAAMRAYTVGASGASFESFLNDPRNASVIASVDNNAFLQEMYFHGQNTIKKEDVAKVSKSAKAEAKATTQNDLQNVFNEVAKVFNINISETATGEESGAFIPSSLKLTLNQDESKNLYQTLHHELMEYSKAYAPKEYNELKSAIMDFATQKLGSPKVKMHLDIYKDTYRGFGAKTGNEAEAKKTLADATDEYVNDFVAMVMSTDDGVNQFVNYLADNSDLTEQQKTGIIQSLKDFIQKLIDSIKAYIAKHKGMNLGAADAKALTQYTEELAQIRDKIQSAWDASRAEVTKQIKSENKAETEVKTEKAHSLNVDSQGNELSKEQIEYFKNSKVRDEDGNLLVMYHGTEEANFTIFDPQYSDDKASLFFTDNEEVANTYAGTSTYVDVNNIRRRGDIKTLKDLQKRFENTDYEVVEDDGQIVIRDSEDTDYELVREDSVEEAYNEWIYNFTESGPNEEFGGLYEVYLNIENPLIIDGDGSTWDYIYPEELVDDDADIYDALRVLKHNEDKTITVEWSLAGGWGGNTERMTEEQFREKFGEGVYNLYLDNGKKLWEDKIILNPGKELLPRNTRELSAYAREHGYDGLIVNDLDDQGAYSADYGEISKVVVAFNSNQVKSIHNKKPTKDVDIRFSLNVDSEGKTLTEDQAKYFKDSKIVDENGNLKVMYHGTDNGNFTVFDSKHSDDKLSLFFTDNKTVAKSYSWNEPKRFDDKDKTGKNVYYETYLNVKNPLRIDAQGRYWNRLQAQKLGYDYGGISVVDVTFQRQADGKYNVISDYIDKNGLWDREELSKYFGKKFLNILDNCPNEATFPNLVVYRGNNVFPNDTRTAAMLAKYGKYDGVVIDNVKDGAGGFGRPKQVASKVVIVFDSNQVKSVDNEHPTEDEDIRFSLEVEDWDKLFSEMTEVKESNRILAEGLKSIDNVKLNKKITDKIASEIKSEYKSRIDKKVLSESLEKVFSYMLDTGSPSYGDLAEIMREVAMPVIEQATEVMAEEKRMYDTFKEKMKGYRIKLNAKQKAEVAQTFGSYYAFKNALFGNVVFSENGSELDSIWQSVVEASDGMLDIGTSDANQPMALYEFIQGLKPSYRNIYGADQEEAAYDVALSIFRKFLLEQEYENNPKLRQEALKLNEAHQKYRKTLKQNSDKRIKEAMDEIKIERQINIKRLIREINELNEEESNVIKGSIEQAFIVKQKEQYERRLKALREYKNEQMDKKLAELRLKQRDSQTKRIQSRQITQAKAKIRKNIEKLNSMLAHGTEKRHVPVNMVRATIEMLEAIDINTGNSKSLAKYLEKMDNIYKGLKGAEAYAFDYDERTQQTLDSLKKMFEGRNYTMLTLDELNQVVDITKQLVTQIENANKIMLDKKKLDAIEFSKQAIKEVREAKGKDNKFMTALDKYLTPHLNAYREFRKISGYTDGAIMELYKDLDKGQLKQLQVMKDINALFDDVLKNTKEVKAFTSTDEKDLVDSGLRDEKDNPVMITKAQRMALIMSSYNERNMEHITFGGVKVPDVKQKKREDALSKGKTYWYESPVEIRDAIYSEDADKLRLITDRASMKVKELEKGLSPWEKEFLDKVKEMFWHKTGSWINKTSLELKGYALARVNNYFPIVSDKNFVNQDVGGLVQDGTLEGWGNLKERKFGRNAIVLEDITDTILRQTNDVAKYVGLVVPIRNLNVAWNTNVYDVTTATRHTLKEAMDVWGANNKKYIENLIKDMTSRRDGGDPTFLDALRGRFAGAVLTLNPSVAIKQTASYFTAGAIVGNKTLAKTVKDIGKGFITKKGIPELEAINPLLWYRNQGNATQELADMKKTGLGKNLPTWMQKALNWVEFMDTGTVRTLEYAAKNYVDDHYIGANKLEGEEYWQKVSEVFTKIVEETQPNYTPLQQADIIRNPNKAMKMLVMFKTQPLQNFGVLYDSIGELKAKMVAKDQEGIKSAKKKVARAIVSQIQSAMTFSMMTILADLLLHKYYKYKDDDDKFSWDKVLAKFGAGITDSFWGMLLFGQDLYKAVDSFINGEQVNGLNVSYLENIANFANAIQKLYQESQKRLEAITEEDKQKYDNGIIIDTGNVINYFGQVVGLPTGNIKNMAESLILYSMDVRDGKIGENEFSRDVDTQNQRMYDALVANDSERYHKLFDEAVLKKTENGTDQDKAEESVESGIKKLIQKGYDSGELTFDEAYTILTKEMGMDETDAYFKLDEWLYKSEGNDSYSRYSRVMDAIDKAISSDDRKDMLTEIKKLMDQGVEAKNIQSQITKEYKTKYLELKAQKKSATLKSILISAYMATGLSRDDAEKRIDKWK